MTFNQFTAKYHINLSPQVSRACLEGIRRMNLSRDPFHDGSHVSRILQTLDQFLRESRETSPAKINFSVLLLAVCWHDIWKSQNGFGSRKKAIFNELYEGVGSMRIFSKSSDGFILPSSVINKTKYAIRKHSSLQIFPKRTLESKILYDLDSLDVWSFIRLRKAIEFYGGMDQITPALLRVGSFYFRHWMMRKTGSKLFYSWSRQEFLNRKARYFDDLYDLAATIKWLSLPSWLSKNRPTTPKTAKSSSTALPE